MKNVIIYEFPDEDMSDEDNDENNNLSWDEGSSLNSFIILFKETPFIKWIFNSVQFWSIVYTACMSKLIINIVWHNMVWKD